MVKSSGQTNKQTNIPTNKHTNKQTNKQIYIATTRLKTISLLSFVAGDKNNTDIMEVDDMEGAVRSEAVIICEHTQYEQPEQKSKYETGHREIQEYQKQLLNKEIEREADRGGGRRGRRGGR